MSDVTQRLAAGLGEHQRIVSKPGGPCWCGEWPRDDERRDTWNDHVAAALTPIVAEVWDEGYAARRAECQQGHHPPPHDANPYCSPSASLAQLSDAKAAALREAADDYLDGGEYAAWQGVAVGDTTADATAKWLHDRAGRVADGAS